MVVSSAGTITDFNSIVKSHGERVRVKYYTESYSGAEYDDSYITQSGSAVWTSGLHFPLNTTTAGDDAKYIEQGKIHVDDRKLYIPTTVNISGAPALKLGIGSPPRDEYSVLNDVSHTQYLNGSPIYHRLYVRILNTGSFINEF